MYGTSKLSLTHPHPHHQGKVAQDFEHEGLDHISSGQLLWAGVVGPLWLCPSGQRPRSSVWTRPITGFKSFKYQPACHTRADAPGVVNVRTASLCGHHTYVAVGDMLVTVHPDARKLSWSLGQCFSAESLGGPVNLWHPGPTPDLLTSSSSVDCPLAGLGLASFRAPAYAHPGCLSCLNSCCAWYLVVMAHGNSTLHTEFPLPGFPFRALCR